MLNIEEENREIVRKAALYMDNVKPDWWANIDPIALDLRDGKLCICGQNGLRWHAHNEASESYTGVFSSVFSNPDYEPFWLEEIAQRMPNPVREPAIAPEPVGRKLTDAPADRLT